MSSEYFAVTTGFSDTPIKDLYIKSHNGATEMDVRNTSSFSMGIHLVICMSVFPQLTSILLDFLHVLGLYFDLIFVYNDIETFACVATLWGSL